MIKCPPEVLAFEYLLLSWCFSLGVGVLEGVASLEEVCHKVAAFEVSKGSTFPI